MGEYNEYWQRRGGERGPDGIANQIILTRSYPGNASLSFLIVEGDTDRKFYARFIDKSRCQISNAFNKSNALRVASILGAVSFPGFLVVVDADFDKLDGKLTTDRNVLFTDTHDLETMIIQSPALEKVLSEMGSEEKIRHITQHTGKDIRTLLLTCGTPIGYLRWISQQESLSLKFENLDIASFIQRGTLALNVSALIGSVKNKSQRLDIPPQYLEASIQRIQNETHDPWHICCGHDLVHILSYALRGTIGSHDAHTVKPDMLETSLRLAFESIYFFKTKLYASIQQWEQENVPFIILIAERD